MLCRSSWFNENISGPKGDVLVEWYKEGYG